MLALSISGLASPELREWIAGQDAVFKNCDGDDKNPVHPNDLPATADPLLRADRNYQIAAAHFYSGHYSDAEAAFDAISHDVTSPWQSIAPYLAARAVIRQISDNLNGFAEPDRLAKDVPLVKDAERRLKAVIDDPRREHWHHDARKLLNLIAFRTEPESLSLSTVNLLTDEKTKLAENLKDFMSLLARQPVRLNYDWDDDSEAGCFASECNSTFYGAKSPNRKSQLLEQFDPTTALLLNNGTPTEILVKIVNEKALPHHLQQRIAPSVWARAALLNQPDLANSVAEAAAEARPELRPFIQEFATAKSQEERRFVAAYAIVTFSADVSVRSTESCPRSCAICHRKKQAARHAHAGRGSGPCRSRRCCDHRRRRQHPSRSEQGRC